MLVTTLGAFAGSTASIMFSDFFENPYLIALSVALTITVTYFLVKIDIESITKRILSEIKKTRE